MLRKILSSPLNKYRPSFNRKIICPTLPQNGIYEPDYLESLKPKYPEYETVNVHIKGYDYPVLESFQKFLHKVADHLDLDVSDCWALPPKNVQIQKFKPSSAVVESEYKLTEYRRHLQICNLPAPIYPIFLRVAQATLPQGVTLEVCEHTEDQEEVRYVPDKDLIELKSQLESLQINNPLKKK